MRAAEWGLLMKVFKNLSLNGSLVDITSEDGKIISIGKTNSEGMDFGGKKVVPGLVDVHTHGMGGFDTMDAVLKDMLPLYAKCGTTTVFPTTMTAPHDAIVKVLTEDVPENGAKLGGFHLEGPYINEKFKGAQNSAYIRNPEAAEFADFDNVKMITIAPELEGAEEFIRATKAVVALGHTDADYDTGVKAAQAGAKCLTHTFNAMRPIHHRNPALIGAASDTGMYVQVICDGKHIHPSAIRLLYKIFGSERMILISDSMRATGLPDGEYEFGGLRIIVKDKTARTESGALAGSTTPLFDCVKKAIEFGIPEQEAFKMASETPAKLMGLNCGTIAEGKDCDLLILDENTEIDTVIINGEIFK